jgi:hypothetical protein
VNARLLGRIHLALAVVWTGLLYPTVVWWKDSILFVGLISVYAIVVAHLAAYDAARAEQQAKETS